MSPAEKLQELCIAKLAELEHDCIEPESNHDGRDDVCASLGRASARSKVVMLRELLTQAGVIGGSNG